MAKRKNSRLFTVGQAVSVDMETGEETQSMPYQMKFKTLKGRWPTWSDAMAHCSPEVQAVWRKGLVESMKEHDLPIPEDLL